MIIAHWRMALLLWWQKWKQSKTTIEEKMMMKYKLKTKCIRVNKKLSSYNNSKNTSISPL